MKIRLLVAPFILLALTSTLAWAQTSVEPSATDATVSANVEQPDVSSAMPAAVVASSYYCSADNETPLIWQDRFRTQSRIATTLVATNRQAGVMLAACPGYVFQSLDNGQHWHVVLSFTTQGLSGTSDYDGITSALNEVERDSRSAHRADILREYLREELDKQYDSDFANYLVDRITDSELDFADDATDIDSLSNIELDMETDLNAVYAERSGDDSSFDRSKDVTIGTSEDLMGLKKATENLEIQPVAWRLFSTPDDSFYLATPDAVYVSSNNGKDWRSFFVAEEDSDILDFALNPTQNLAFVVTTNGVWHNRSLAEDGWQKTSNYNGDQPMLVATSATNVVVVDKGDLWISRDEARSFIPFIDVPFNVDVIRDLTLDGDQLYVLTEKEIWQYSTQSGQWLPVSPDGIEANATLEKLYITDKDELVLLSENNVYIRCGGQGAWQMHDNGLLGERIFSITQNSQGQFVLGTQQGVMITSTAATAQDDAVAFRQLEDRWRAEPKPNDILDRIVLANPVLGFVDANWELRNGLSYLLPKVTARIYSQQYHRDKREYTYVAPPTNADLYSQRAYRNKVFRWDIFAMWSFSPYTYEKVVNTSRRLSLSIAKERQRLFKMALAYILDRKRLQVRLATDSKLSGVSRQKALLNLEEIEAHLDYLTGGFYSTAISAVKND